MSRLHWFPLAPLTADHATLLGIDVKPASGRQFAYWHEEARSYVVEVGDVTAYRDGRVSAWPRTGAGTGTALAALLTSAERAVLGDTPDTEGWATRETGTTSYRRCSVLMLVDRSHPLAMALRCANELGVDEVERERLDLRAGFGATS